jgi:hypothetical protein
MEHKGRCLRSTITHLFARNRWEDKSCYGYSRARHAYNVRNEV